MAHIWPDTWPLPWLSADDDILKIPPRPLPERPASWRTLALIGAVALVAAVVFLSKPDIDLIASAYFYKGGGEFIGQSDLWIRIVRNIFIIFFWACVALAIAGLVHTREPGASWLGFTARHWLFLAICLGVGPGLVANVMFKDQWGRARPKQVVEFGGTKTFTPPILFSSQCPRNCSFVSGEASSTYLPFYAAAVMLPQAAVPLVVTGTVMGLAAGTVRMAQGGHFLSDVIYAGVLMALTVLIVRRLMFGPPIMPGLRRRLFGGAPPVPRP
ncbi:MAG: phosphatase PAP2 family protein [Hyphomicrobiaceae bacterium]|nr:phosphatase PAP2 family protein [Hyphomicrobiaceae bacterium]